LRVIRSIDELLLLPSDRRVNGMGPREPIQLEIPGLARHAQIRAQQRLNRLQSRCGCVAGAVAMLASVALGALRVYTRHAGPPSWNLLWESLAVLVAAFTIGFVAKMSVLAVTRWQFAYECAVQCRVLDEASGGDASDVQLHALGR
jgi:hypothetical protein